MSKLIYINEETGNIRAGSSDLAPLNSPTFSGTVAGITKAMVGLDSVDNTTDASKPISSLTQTALNLKADLASPTFTGTVAGITKAMVGLDSVDNTTDASKPISSATQTALDAKAPLGIFPLGAPASPVTGSFWFDILNKELNIFNGTLWLYFPLTSVEK